MEILEEVEEEEGTSLVIDPAADEEIHHDAWEIHGCLLLILQNLLTSK